MDEVREDMAVVEMMEVDAEDKTEWRRGKPTEEEVKRDVKKMTTFYCS